MVGRTVSSSFKNPLLCQRFFIIRLTNKVCGSFANAFRFVFNKLHHTCAATALIVRSGSACQMKGHGQLEIYAVQPAAYIIPNVNHPLDVAV